MTKSELDIKGRFDWCREKDELNIKKHGFSFEQILDVFDDPSFYEIFDENHSDIGQYRFFGLGCTNGFSVVATSYTAHDRIPLISSPVSYTTLRAHSPASSLVFSLLLYRHTGCDRDNK